QKQRRGSQPTSSIRLIGDYSIESGPCNITITTTTILRLESNLRVIWQRGSNLSDHRPHSAQVTPWSKE
ncbi:hypothetical protein, partial [Thiolapillus sp.]|uniref:hypothetical protein n=1 Tax=Thiolapillus sp. TaxID=2017437 RepID=UPI003AF8F3A5